MKPYKIAIGFVDNHPSLAKPFALSLVAVTTSFQVWAAKQKRPYTLDVLMAENGRVDDMRNTIANQAVREGYDLLFWMDSDMVFPRDCLIRMLQYIIKDKYEAVTGLYTFKTPPFFPHVYARLHEETGKFELASSWPLDQPFTVDGAGFGCLLMKVDVFARMQTPYFTMRFEDGKLTQGEDLTFCRIARMNMLMDPTVRCGHLKMCEFGIANFVGHNGIKVEDGWLKPTPEQKQKIVEDMGHIFNNE